MNMVKRILSGFLPLCLILAILPTTALATGEETAIAVPTTAASQSGPGFNAPSWGGWGTIDYDGKTAGNPIGLLLYDQDESDAIYQSGAILESGSNRFVLQGGKYYADPSDLLGRIRSAFYYEDDGYYDEIEPFGEYSITLFSTAERGWPSDNTILPEDTTAFNTIEGKIQLLKGSKPVVSPDAEMLCKWEYGSFGAYDKKLTLDFNGSVEPGWYSCMLDFPDQPIVPGQYSGSVLFWLFAGPDGKLSDDGQPFDWYYEEGFVPVGAPQLTLYKVAATISPDQLTQTISVSPPITFTGTGMDGTHSPGETEPRGHLTVGSGTASPGQTVSIPITLDENPGITSMALDVQYDRTAMSLISVTDSGALRGAMHSGNLSLYPYELNWDTYAGDMTATGTIVTLTFAVEETAPADSYPITVTCWNGAIYNEELNEVPFDIENGVVTVTPPLSGDMNGDGRVTNLDRTSLARYLARWSGYDETTVDLLAADVNQDGRVTNLDRTILARHLAKWAGYETLPYKQ